MGRRRFLAAGSTATALLGGFPARLLAAAPRTGRAARVARVAADPAVTGSWTAPFSLGLVSIHAVLLHTGNVLLFSWPNDTVGSDAVLWNPVTGRITNIALTYQRDIFCSGTTVLPDGRVFIAGGHIWQGALNPTQGVINTTIFDPASSAWTEGPLMSQARWYPATTLLGNGTVIICGGTVNTGTNASTVDRYHPASNTINKLPSTADKPMVTYPRVKLTTGGLLAWTNSATTYYLNPATATWTTGPKLESGNRTVTDMSVLLPGLTEILEAGGTTSSGVTSTAELLSLSASQPAWAYTSAMHFARQWANSVLLPDGTVLVVGGGAAGYYDGPVRTPEIYHPATRTWTEMAAQTAPRMYHSTALLLPDGRVLSAGGRREHTAEVFSPPYLFKGARPTIGSAPGVVAPGSSFFVATPDASRVTKVTLIALGSVTHAFDENQRLLTLGFTRGSTGLTLTAPANNNLAPPGYYMLFLVNDAGVPSIGQMVRISTL